MKASEQNIQYISTVILVQMLSYRFMKLEIVIM